MPHRNTLVGKVVAPPRSFQQDDGDEGDVEEEANKVTDDAGAVDLLQLQRRSDAGETLME